MGLPEGQLLVDAAERARRRLAVLWLGSVYLVLSLVMALVMLWWPGGSEPRTALALAGLAAVVGALVWLAARGHVRVAAWGLVTVSTLGMLVAQVARHQVGFTPFYVVFGVWVGVVALDFRDVLGAIALSALTLLVMFIIGRDYPWLEEPPTSAFVNGAFTFALLACVGLVATLTLRRLIGEVGRQETEVLRAREVAREAAKRAELIATNTSDYITVFDAQRTVLWSCAGRQTLPVTGPDAWVNTAARYEYVNPEDLPTIQADLTAGIAGESRRSEVRIRRPDGTWGWFQTVTTPVKGEALVVMAMHDISEERRLASQLAVSQKMEALGRLAGGVAHDFNNLLTVMQTCAALIRRDASHGSHGEAQDLDDLQTAIDGASSLTKQLLAFSRRDGASPTRVEVDKVVTPVVDMARRLLGRDIEVRLHVEPGSGAVQADASQLEQVVMNLAVNARDAMPNGGVLEVRVEPAHDASLGNVTQLAVRDSGVGMDDVTRSRIFEPFFTTKPAGRGTGLGLATVYGVVRSMGGRIDVDSAPGQGTEFRVLLPAGPPSRAPNAA